ncbi:MAG: DUF1254 domain-containing protein [Roseibium sp.]|nr:DUF1254 domain-containing protein [Roseibium sp.]
MRFFLSLAVSLVLQSQVALASDKLVDLLGYNTPIPEDILTPDEVETRFGTLKFVDGRPTPETSALMYDTLDFMRGVEVFLNFIPATSIEGIRRGMDKIGVDAAHKVAVFEELMDSNPLFLTGNTDTVYASSILDLGRDGPTVIEVPKGQGPTTVNDAYFRFVTDMGVPGPDKGEGGKYLILPPDYEGDLDPPVGGYAAEVEGETYFVSKSASYINWFIARGFLVDGKTDAAVAAYRNGLKIYPLKDKSSPPQMKFMNASKKVFNTIHANTFEFYNELDTVLQKEPVSTFDPELRGLAAAIGIEKGKSFAPDDRMTKILTEAVAVGNATARTIWLKPRDKAAYLYENSGWYTAFIGGNWQWLRDEGNGGRYLDARTMFFYMATVNTPAMVLKLPGKGSQYALSVTDSSGTFLDGSKSYTLTIPADVPARDFWSVVVYDPQTRSELQTSQPFPSKNNKRDKLQENGDGSITLHFGPEAPPGKEQNWIQTVAGKGWFTILRLYGPEEAWFEKTWRPGEIELVE